MTALPVRGVCVINDTVLYGLGGSLIVCCSGKNTLSQENITLPVFPENIIQKIKRVNMDTMVCLSGKAIRVVNIASNNTISCFSPVVYFADWVTDVILEKDVTILYILTAHNIVLSLCMQSFTVLELFNPDNCCILYSGLLWMNEDKSVICLSGTVFNEIQVWDTTDNTLDTKVKYRLLGHSGVILTMDYSDNLKMLVSGSDDRAICTWILDLNCMENTGKCEIISPVHTLFLHSARVQAVRFIAGNHVISTGEDCFICCWSLESESVVGRFCAHKGINVFGLSVTENYFITSGEDGAVIKWNLQQFLQNNSFNSLTIRAQSSSGFRLVSIQSESILLLLTFNGDCIRYNVQSKLSETIFSSKDLTDYAVWDVSDTYCVLGCLSGKVIIHSFLSSSSIYCPVSECKVTSIHVFASNFLVSSTEPYLHLCCLKTGDVLSKFSWPIFKNNWPNSALIFKQHFLCCGDRNGTVWVYDISVGNEPIQVLTRCHSKLGVMHLLSNNDTLYTSGRDGKINVYSMLGGIFESCGVISLTDSINWISKLSVNEGRMIAMCFKSDSVLVWDVTSRREIAREACGGGHRSFDFRISSDMLQFAYIKGNEVACLRANVKKTEPFTIMRSAFHGKHVNCLASVLVDDIRYVVTAAEDSTLVISSCSQGELSPMTSLPTYASCVRTLSLHQISPSEYYLLAAGSRIMISLWKLTFPSRDCPGSRLQTVLIYCTSSAEKHSSMESVNELIDAKFTASCVLYDTSNVDAFSFLLTSSDASFSIYQLQQNKLKLMDSQTNLCTINKVLHLNESSFLYADNFSNLKVQLIESSIKFAEFCDVKTHLGSINSIDIRDDLIVCGGDSGGLALVHYSKHDFSLKVVRIFDDRHATQITGCHWLSKNMFLSLGIDQRIKLWKISDESELELTKNLFTHVSDVSSSLFDSYSSTLLVAGRGLQSMIVDFCDSNCVTLT